MPKPCKHCGSDRHGSTFCFRAPKKAIAKTTRIKQKGKRTLEYEVWRDTVARPYLDKTYGHVCANCGLGDYGMHILDVDHKLNRGSHPELKKVLTNVQWLGRYPCHSEKTDRIKGKERYE